MRTPNKNKKITQPDQQTSLLWEASQAELGGDSSGLWALGRAKPTWGWKWRTKGRLTGRGRARARGPKGHLLGKYKDPGGHTEVWKRLAFRPPSALALGLSLLRRMEPRAQTPVSPHPRRQPGSPERVHRPGQAGFHSAP